MKIAFMAFVALVTWSLHLIVGAVLWLIGFPLCFILLTRNAYWKRNSDRWPERVLLEWRTAWAWIYGNEEDGIDGSRGGDPAQSWWLKRTDGYAEKTRIFVWSAWRNPVGNLRFVRPFGFLIDPAKVNFVGNSIDPEESHRLDPSKSYWYFAWCGLYSGLWVIVFGIQLRIGWKILPRDAKGLAPDDYRRHGCGFALQLHRAG